MRTQRWRSPHNLTLAHYLLTFFKHCLCSHCRRAQTERKQRGWRRRRRRRTCSDCVIQSLWRWWTKVGCTSIKFDFNSPYLQITILLLTRCDILPNLRETTQKTVETSKSCVAEPITLLFALISSERHLLHVEMTQFDSCATSPFLPFDLGGKGYDPEKMDYSDFKAWLRCYYVDGMKSIRDHNGRTMWFKVGLRRIRCPNLWNNI